MIVLTNFSLRIGLAPYSRLGLPIQYLDIGSLKSRWGLAKYRERLERTVDTGKMGQGTEFPGRKKLSIAAYLQS